MPVNNDKEYSLIYMNDDIYDYHSDAIINDVVPMDFNYENSIEPNHVVLSAVVIFDDDWSEFLLSKEYQLAKMIFEKGMMLDINEVGFVFTNVSKVDSVVNKIRSSKAIVFGDTDKELNQLQVLNLNTSVVFTSSISKLLIDIEGKKALWNVLKQWN